MNLFGLHDMSKYVDFWFKLAAESSVEVITLSESLSIVKNKYYVLPMDVIEVKSLARLVLEGRIKVGSTFMNRSIKFLSLRELSMTGVILGDEHTIEHLISCCPLIEYITLKECVVLSPGGDQIDAIKCLNLNGLQKLKGVDVSRIQEVFVDSPSLENLHYYPDFNKTFKIDFD
ncbi:F-box/LRR-repeat protein, partial [Trifolium pratense]